MNLVWQLVVCYLSVKFNFITKIKIKYNLKLTI